jgi:hypothetical protein
MIAALSEQQRRGLAAGLLILPALLFVWLGIGLVTAHNAHHADMARLLLERRDDKALLQRAPAWSRDRDTLAKLSANTPLFFDAAQPASAVTRMQTEVSNVTAADHITATRNDVELVAENDRKRTELRMVLSFDADIATVSRVLFHLRQARPLLFVRKLDLRATPQPTAAQSLAGPNMLQTELTIIGFVQVP